MTPNRQWRPAIYIQHGGTVKPDHRPEQPAPAKPAVKEPSVGDGVQYQGYVHGEGGLHAVVSRVYGDRVVNVSYLTPSGAWFSAQRVSYDSKGSPGTWRWKD